MHARDGSEVPNRTWKRPLGCLTAIAFALSALAAAPAGAAAAPTYLALGDSVSYGYTQEKFEANAPGEPASAFEAGFVNIFAKKLKGKAALGKTGTVVNDSCPNETTRGLIGESEQLGGQTSTESYEEAAAPGGYQGLGDWHPCAYANFSGFPLHHEHGASSQLEDAVQLIAGGNVKAITLDVGSADERAAWQQCEDEVAAEMSANSASEWPKGSSKTYGPSEQAAAVDACISWTSSNVTSPEIIENVQDILGVIDGSGYTGPIVVVGYYNAATFQHQGTDRELQGLNETMANEVIPHFDEQVEDNVTYANPFPKFNHGKEHSVKEQKAICTYTEACNPNVQPPGSDPSPSLAGQKQLAKLVRAAYLANPAK